MSLKETLLQAHEALLKADIKHALIGGLGLAALGIQRTTNDVDFLADGEQTKKIKEVLVQSGWQLTMETKNVLHFEGKGKVDIVLALRPLSIEMLSQAKSGLFNIPCVNPEGMIGLKIQAYKNDSNREFQDKADIQSVIQRYPNLDWNKIKEYADLFGEWGFIDSLKRKK